MCVGIPARVVELDETGTTAVVEVEGVRREVNCQLVDDAEVGAWVLLHVGFAMARIDEDEAERTLSILREMGAIYDEEIAALRGEP